MACTEVVVEGEAEEEGEHEAENGVHGHGHVVLGDVSGDEEALEGLQEGARSLP